VKTTLDAAQQAALDWAGAQLGVPLDRVVLEPMKQRPWASTWRLRPSSADRVVYLKVAAASTRYEVALTAILGRAAPSSIPAVLATEPARGWLLLADAGRPLRERLNGEFDAAAWQDLLPRFGELQRAVEPFADELLAAGVPDERPECYPDLLDRLQRPDLLNDQWEDDAQGLRELGLPASVQHGDLHDANVGLSVNGADGTDGVPRFFDFGDASLAHPFTTLLVPLRVARSQGADDGEIEQLRDSYLEPFTDRADRSDLRRGLDLALRTAPLLRATSWQRALIEAPAEHEWGDPVAGWLEELIASTA
jgi:hypothetical protein